ncbi:LiaI-LiaF-like domain-containing protein [Bacteroidota bacterium]
MKRTNEHHYEHGEHHNKSMKGFAESFKGCCSNRGSITFPLLLIAVGVIFLLDHLKIISGGMGAWWPVLVIIIGFGMLAKSCKKK